MSSKTVSSLFRNIFIAGLVFVGGKCFSAPEVKIPVIAAEPVIDGKMDKEEWQNAACASGFISTDNEWPARQTSAYIAVAGQYLYFAFKCQLSGSGKVKAGKYKKDSTKIFRDESVELFLAPETAGKVYYHLAFNAVGSVYTAKCGERRDTAWEPELKFASGSSQNNWILEGRLSLASVAAKNAFGTKWKINFCRNTQSSIRQSSSWTGQHNFNDKGLMGNAEISRKIFVDYSLENLDSLTGLKLVLRNHQSRKAVCKVTTAENVRSYCIAPEKNEEIFAVLPSSACGKKLTLTINGDNFKYQKTALLYYYKKFSIIPDLYYLVSPINKLGIKIDNQIKNSSAIKIKLYFSGNKKALRKMELMASETACSINLKDLSCGRYVLSAQLFAGNGKKLAEDDKLIFITKKVEFPALPEKQDIRIGKTVFFMNGKPFFPFMISSAVPDMAACFNVKYGTKAVIKNAPWRGTCGVPVKLRRTPITFREIPDEETVKNKIIDFIKKTSNEKYLYRNIQYEAQIPLFRPMKDGLKALVNTLEYRKIYALIKKNYPETLTSIQIERFERVKDFADCADIIETASRTSSYARNPTNNLAADIGNVRGRIGDKPLIWWLGASIPSPEDRTAEKIRASAYLALMNGVNGIIFHNGHGGVPASRTRLWSVFPNLASELEFLYPVIQFGEKTADKNIQVKSSEVKFIVRRQKGDLFIIAINNSPSTVNGEFSLTSLNNAKVEVLFENRELELKNGTFSDSFTQYEPHVYVVKIK